MTPIQLPPIKEGLKTIRKAFNAGQLQFQLKTKRPPMYSGPCAVGVLLTPDQREVLDNLGKYATITQLATQQKVNSDDIIKYSVLQRAHDTVMHDPLRNPVPFDEVLTGMEAEYG